MARRIKDKALDEPRGPPQAEAARQALLARHRAGPSSRLSQTARQSRNMVGASLHWQAEDTLSRAIGAADDLSDADGVAVLDFWQAQTKARAMMVSRAHTAAGKTGPLTVSDIMEGRVDATGKPEFVGYLAFLDSNRKSGDEAHKSYRGPHQERAWRCRGQCAHHRSDQRMACSRCLR